MTFTLWLFLAGLAFVAFAAFLTIRIVLDMRQRIVVTVARPTTTDGEQVQLTANLKASLGAGHIAETIERMSLAIQHRVLKQNEIVAQTDAEVAHKTWLRIREKLDNAEKEGRRGLGVLSKAERAWWNQHRDDFDRDGPKVGPGRVAQAARGESEAVEAEKDTE